MKEIAIAPETIIYEQGQPGNRLFFVISGEGIHKIIPKILSNPLLYINNTLNIFLSPLKLKWSRRFEVKETILVISVRSRYQILFIFLNPSKGKFNLLVQCYGRKEIFLENVSSLVVEYEQILLEVWMWQVLFTSNSMTSSKPSKDFLPIMSIWCKLKTA